MKKSYYIGIIVIVAGLAAFYLQKRNSSTLKKRDTIFRVEDIKKVDRINISSGDNSLELTYDNKSWMLNNERADNERIANLLIIAQQLEVISPAPRSDFHKLSDQLSKGTAVSYFSGKKLLNSYSICKSDMKIYASRYRSDFIFQVEARGYSNVDLTAIFNPAISFWTAKKTISYTPEEITGIRIHYPDDPGEDFTLLKANDDQFSISNHVDDDLSDIADHEFIALYLKFFSELPYAAIEDQESPGIDSQKEPFFILLVSSDVQSNSELKGYRKMKSENQALDMKEFYGMINGERLVKLNYEDFDPVLLKLKDFLKK